MKKQEERLDHFLELCQQTADQELLKELFSYFFTHEELEMVGARFEILKALLEGKLTQREIADRHQLSIAKITRGSNALKIISPQLMAFFKKHLLSDEVKP